MQHPDVMAQWKHADWNLAPGNQQPGRPSRPPSKPRSANTHEFSLPELVPPPDDACDAEDDTYEDNTDANTQLLAHVTQTKTLPSSEIRNILEQSNNPCPSPHAPKTRPLSEIEEFWSS